MKKFSNKAMILGALFILILLILGSQDSNSSEATPITEKVSIETCFPFDGTILFDGESIIFGVGTTSKYKDVSFKPGDHPCCKTWGLTETKIKIGNREPISLPMDEKHWEKNEDAYKHIYWLGTFNFKQDFNLDLNIDQSKNIELKNLNRDTNLISKIGQKLSFLTTSSCKDCRIKDYKGDVSLGDAHSINFSVDIGNRCVITGSKLISPDPIGGITSYRDITEDIVDTEPVIYKIDFDFSYFSKLEDPEDEGIGNRIGKHKFFE